MTTDPTDPTRDPTTRRWLVALVVSVALCLLAMLLEVIGFVTGTKELWIPAAALFPVAFIASIVCQVVLVRRGFRRPRR